MRMITYGRQLNLVIEFFQKNLMRLDTVLPSNYRLNSINCQILDSILVSDCKVFGSDNSLSARSDLLNPQHLQCFKKVLCRDKDAKAEKTSKSIESASKISAGSVKSSGKKSRHFPSTSTPQQVKFPIAQDNLKGENNLDEQKSASSLKSSCKTSSPGPKGLSTQLPGRKSSKRRKSNSETVFENIRSPEEKKVASSAIQSQEKSGQEVQNEENIQEKEVLQSPKKKDQNERKPESSTIQIDSSIQQTESSLDRDSKQKPKKPGRKNRNVVFSESTVSDTEMPQSGGNDLAQEDESDVVSLEKENLADKDIISGGDQTNPKRRVLKHPKRNQESPKQKLGAPNEFHSEKIDEQLSKDIAEKASNKKVKRDKETDSREENLEKKSKASAPGWILNNDPKAGSTKQKVSSGEKKTQKAPGSDGMFPFENIIFNKFQANTFMTW